MRTKIMYVILISIVSYNSVRAQRKRHELPYDVEKNKVAWVGEVSIDSGMTRKDAAINLIQWAYKNSFTAESENLEAGVVVLRASIQYTNNSEKLHKAPFRIFFIIDDTTLSYRITDMTVNRYPIEVRYEHGKKNPSMGPHFAFIDIDKRINQLIAEFSAVNQE